MALDTRVSGISSAVLMLAAVGTATGLNRANWKSAQVCVNWENEAMPYCI